MGFCISEMMCNFTTIHFNLNLFILIRGYLLYNIVLVLPYINMNPPRVYTHSQSWTFSSPPKEAQHLSAINSELSHPLPRGKHQSTFCLYGFVYLRHFIWMDSSNMWSFVTGFFHGAHLCSFLWPNNIQLHGYTTPHFLDSLVNWDFPPPHFLCIMNNDAMKIHVQSFFFFLFLWENVTSLDIFLTVKSLVMW